MNTKLLFIASLWALATRCSTAMTVVGYTNDSSITQHLRLDLDLSSMFDSLALKTPAGFAAANTTYSKGNVLIMLDRLQHILHGFNT